MAKAPGATAKRARSGKKSEGGAYQRQPRGAHGPLIVSISGIRGIAGDTLSAETVLSWVTAFVHLVRGPRIVVGHDARESVKWILPLVEGTLVSLGMEVVSVGLAPTPTVGLLTRRMKAAGGICITASHNPMPYNGLKFFHAAGEFINHEMLANLKALREKPPVENTIAPVGRIERPADPHHLHIKAITTAFPPPDQPRGAKFLRVIIDCCNSAGAIIAPDIADAYGAAFQLINSDTRKYTFPRGAEPTEENIVGLRKAVVKERADLGFAIDPDADRLAIVDEMGRAIGEERTLVLAADSYLTNFRRKSPIVVNLSTSRAIDDLAKRHKVPVHRTAIGEANVLAGMREHGARLGGEGNGGVIVPAVQPGRDSATAIALILLGLQARGGTISQWNASIPEYALIKSSAPLAGLSVAKALTRVRQAFKGAAADTTDGVKLSYEDRWIHVRPSNTEPIVRLFAEAPNSVGAQELIDKAAALLR